MAMIATVLIPTYNHEELIRYAAKSALNQTIQEIEVFIVGDGATPKTRAAAEALTREDERVRFFDNPKGPRRGEVHRHAALTYARGEIVCYLSDQDLWLPDHVETMLKLLQHANFAGARPMHIKPDGSIGCWLGTFNHSYFKEKMLAGTYNFFGLSSGAHRLDLYRKLPHGWRTTPEHLWTDLYMWQQFLEHPDCVPAEASHPTVLVFPASDRPGWNVAERLRESEIWQYRLENEGRAAIERTFYEGVFLMATNYYIREIIAGGLNQAVAERDGQISGLNQAVAERDVRIAAILSSTSWRLTRPMRLLGDMLKGASYLLRITPQIIARKGGIWRTCAAALRVYRREGFAGIKYRIKQLPISEDATVSVQNSNLKDTPVKQVPVLKVLFAWVVRAIASVNRINFFRSRQ